MKRFLIFCGLMTAIFLSYAVPVEYKDVIPAQGSAISSWSFTLKFDIANALASVTDTSIQYGIGYSGSEKKKQYAALYKGDVSEENLLGIAMTSNVTGKSEEFKVNGDEINIEFDSSIPIIKGQEYILQITNTIVLCKETGAIVSNTKLDYSSEPLTLKFIGGDVNSTQFILSSSSVKNGDSLKSLSFAEFVFAHPIKIDSSKYISINEGNKEIARSESLSLSEDNTVLRADFGREISLNATHSYTLFLPEGIAEHAEEASLKNAETSYLIYGLSTYTCPVQSVKTEGTNPNLPSGIVITYDIPEKLTFTQQSSYTGGIFDMAYLYDDSQPDAEPLYSFVGVRLNDGKSIKWDLSNISFVPSSKYVFRTLDNYYIFEIGGNILNEYSPESEDIEFTTPTIEEAGYMPMEFSIPTVSASDYGVETQYSEGMKLQYLKKLQVGLKDRYYVLNGKNYDPVLHPNINTVDAINNVIYLYEVTDNGDVIINKSRLSLLRLEDSKSFWNEYTIDMNTPLYEGKNYKLVIPQCFLTVQYNSYGLETGSDYTKVNYIFNPELVYTFEGSMPATFRVKSCNIADNSKMNKLHTIVWEIEGLYNLSDEIIMAKFDQVMLEGYNLKGELPVSLYQSYGNTYLRIDFINNTTGEPKKLNSQQSIEITLPAGLLVNTLNPDIVSDEVVLHINGSDNDVIAETVSVAVRVNGLHETKHASVKGTPYSLALTPVDNWVVESVTHDGNALTEKNGIYTTEALSSDATIEATLAYNGPWMIEHTTGVFGIEDSKVRVFTENDMIVVDGVSSSDNIKVFNVAGMLIESVTPQNDRVNISVAPGQIYIVTVNGHAAKVQL